MQCKTLIRKLVRGLTKYANQFWETTTSSFSIMKELYWVISLITTTVMLQINRFPYQAILMNILQFSLNKLGFTATGIEFRLISQLNQFSWINLEVQHTLRIILEVESNVFPFWDYFRWSLSFLASFFLSLALQDSKISWISNQYPKYKWGKNISTVVAWEDFECVVPSAILFWIFLATFQKVSLI
jgi:hypothetical protein